MPTVYKSIYRINSHILTYLFMIEGAQTSVRIVFKKRSLSWRDFKHKTKLFDVVFHLANIESEKNSAICIKFHWRIKWIFSSLASYRWALADSSYVYVEGWDWWKRDEKEIIGKWRWMDGILFLTECTVDKRRKEKECDDDDAFLCGNFGVIRARNIEFLSVELKTSFLRSILAVVLVPAPVFLFWRHRRMLTNSKYLHSLTHSLTLRRSC